MQINIIWKIDPYIIHTLHFFKQLDSQPSITMTNIHGPSGLIAKLLFAGTD